MDKDKIIELAKQPSTWRGLSIFLGAIGVGIAPALVLEIGTAVATIIGVVEMVRDENKK